MTNYSAFVSDLVSALYIIDNFPKKFEKHTDMHVTYCLGAPDEDFFATHDIEVVGYASNDVIEALVVKVDGKLIRKDGNIYHITLSYNPQKARAKDSNILLKNGWTAIEPFKINYYPVVR